MYWVMYDCLCIIFSIMLLTSLFEENVYFLECSLWQQAGRSGRRGKQSLAVYVALEGPLDQYFMKFPQKLFGSPIECCQVDAHNQQVLLIVFTCDPSVFMFWTHITFRLKHMYVFLFAYLHLKATAMVHFKECYFMYFILEMICCFEYTGTRW